MVTGKFFGFGKTVTGGGGGGGISDPDLLSRWLFNEGSGSTAVDSVGGKNLTLNNGATWGASSVLLDGVNDYLSAASVNYGFDTQGFGAAGMSIAFYIKTSASAGRIINKQIADSWNTFRVIQSGTGLLTFDVNNSFQTGGAGEYPAWTNHTPVTLTSFTHICFTWKVNSYNSSDCVMYINKSAVTTDFVSNFYNTNDFAMEENTNNLIIGARPVTIASFWAGELKDLQIYKDVLTAGEVAALP